MRLKLPTTTLAIIDTQSHALAERALSLSTAQIDFARVLFLSDRPPARPGFEHVKIPVLRSRAEYSRFVIRDLVEHIRSDHVLLIQWDGYVTHPEAWTAEFLEWDYIGAPWGFHRDKHRVGNGGFSLRSRKLLQALQDPAIDLFDPEDEVICRRFRPLLEERHGIRFSPEELAGRFSFETTYPKSPPFGFHGLFNAWMFLKDDEVDAFVGDMPAHTRGSVQLLQLARNFVDLRRLDAARAVLRRRLEANPQDTDANVLLERISPAARPPATARVDDTTSRNAPCPCGSGKRFKHCCGSLTDAGPADAPRPDAVNREQDFARASQEAFAHHQAGRLVEAREAYDRALNVREDPLVLHYRGVIDLQQGEPQAGEQRIRRALQQRNDVPDMHNNLGLCLRAQRRLRDAVECYRQSVALDPGYCAGWNNIGLDLHSLGDYQGALTAYDRALSVEPRFAQARFGRALLSLTHGDYANGWNDYEYRSRCPEYASQYRLPRMPSQPRAWSGDLTALAGRSILLMAEQGLGDTIQFARYAALLAEHAREVNLYTPKRETHALLATAPGVARVFGPGDTLPPQDFVGFMMSLPRLCGTRDIDRIPAPARYLETDPQRRADWHHRLAKLPASDLKVGLCWAGNPTHTNDHNRSCPLAALEPLFALRNVSWISLQIGPAGAQIDPARHPIHDWTSDIGDYADTAALMDELDLVISVDTSVAHASGALGRPTWVLLPHVPDFRWLLERSDSPWYPSLRLFRQISPNAWDQVIASVAGEIDRMIGKRNAD